MNEPVNEPLRDPLHEALRDPLHEESLHERSGPRFWAQLGPGAGRGRGAGGRTGAGGGARHEDGGRSVPLLEGPLLTLSATGARVWPSGNGASWSPTPLPADVIESAATMAQRHDAVSIVDHGDRVELHGGISGAVPVYVDLTGEVVSASSSIASLLRRRRTITPDWDGWAQMLASGAPLDGRTTVDGIRRLRPWERITVDRQGRVTADDSGWPWLEHTPQPGATLEPVAESLSTAVAELVERDRPAPLLSGGWDSRILTALACRHAGAAELTARTTSSDTGTVMEELVASTVAEHLGIRHRLLMPRRDQVGADIARFAEAVDHQTSFHVWFVPVQRDLAPGSGTVLDGLGGGLFLGGAFPDPPGTGGSDLDSRFDRLTHYLSAAPAVLARPVIDAVRDRTRAGFEPVAAPLAGHPFAPTFTAYLNRTLPGISLAPYGLLASSAPVATPFLDDRVVSAALRLPPAQHADGQLYPQLLRRFDPRLAALPTAEQLAPWPRPHPRRISSPEGVRSIRELVLAEPVRGLISDELAAAPPERWSHLLSTTGSQHLLRGLAVMSLWFTRHREVLTSDDVRELST